MTNMTRMGITDTAGATPRGGSAAPVAALLSFYPPHPQQFITPDLADRAGQHLLRSRRIVTHLTPTSVRIDDATYVDFASNNYLGLTHHPALIDAVRSAAREVGVGSGAAPLITGYSPHHAA